MNHDLEQIGQRLQEFQTAWNSLDIDRLSDLWDTEESEIYYLAEEMDEPFLSFEEVKSYWRATSQIIHKLHIDLSDINCRLLTSEIGVATFRMHVDAVMMGFELQGFKPIGSDVKVTVIMRRRHERWGFIHYMEAHLGALPFLRRIYNQNVRTDFADE